jgi:hypothetical protein
MADLINWLGANFHDLGILVITAIALALFGSVVAWVSHLLWFHRWPERSAFDNKLADTAHTSLLGLSAFVLALMISNGVASLSKAEENVRLEGVSIYRLARELDALGQDGAAAKAALVAYVHDVAGDEWKGLGAGSGVLSSSAQRDLDALWTSLRALQTRLGASEPRRGDLTQFALKIETSRQLRLAGSTSNIPDVFWLILLTFLAAASFLAGREAPNRLGIQVNMLHMAAIGLAIGLVIVLADPFRGDTSIDPAIIGVATGP